MTNPTEFNLSEKRFYTEIGFDKDMEMQIGWQYLEEDVKEFIRLLKERFGEWIYETEDLACAFSIIDKLAGEKLK